MKRTARFKYCFQPKLEICKPGCEAHLLVSSFFKKNLFIYFCLCWVFVAACGLSLVAASGGYSQLRHTGFSLRWLLLLWSMGSRHAGSVLLSCGLQSAGSVAVAQGLSCSAACGIFPGQGSNPCPLHWQADSQPLCRQGSPLSFFLQSTVQVSSLVGRGTSCPMATIHLAIGPLSLLLS